MSPVNTPADSGTLSPMSEREKVVTLRLSDDEHAAWTAAATADGRTLSNWIRQHCNAVTPKPKKKAKR